ncbi:hypothetical protein FRB99_007752 [Tulasnella sp. 403]|nr:hypothetical protein FRB99_007752 [Tulasnella sp. 403]
MSMANSSPSDDDTASVTVAGSGTISPAKLPPDPELQPLLSSKRHPTPLPVFQLAILCYVRLAEPIAYTQIFPYVNQMVEEMHITRQPSDVGFYSGLVDSLFAIAQLFTAYHWGRLSDRVGRKPIILTGLAGVSLASTCFGLSTRFYQLLVARAMAGALSGNVAVINSILGELTDETNHAKGHFLFHLVPLSGAFFCVGAVIGPLIGGLLSHPAERYPSIFGPFDFLKNHPYFLPCFVSSAITCSSAILAAYFLEETLASKVLEKKLKEAQKRQSETLLSSSSTPATCYLTFTPTKTATPSTLAPTPAAPKSMSSVALLANERIRQVLLSTLFLSFICMCYETVFVLWAYTPVPLGGLARKADEIGYVLSATGVLGIFAVILIYPALHSRFGTVPVYVTCMALWPIVFALMPILGEYGRATLSPDGTSKDPSVNSAIMGGLLILHSLARVACMAFCSNILLAKAAAPNAESMGGTFGLAQCASCIARATAPAFISSIFAISADKQIMHGNFVWFVSVAMSIWGVYITMGLRE